MRKHLAWVVGVLAVVFLLAFLVGPNAEERAMDSARLEKARAASAALVRSLPPLKAEEIARAYAANELAADRQYKGGPRRSVRGVVALVGREILGRPYVAFATVPGVQAVFPREATAELEALRPGDAWVARGCVGRGRLGNVLFECEGRQ